MLKVHILVCSPYCDGQAYLPEDEATNWKGEPYTRYTPCQLCEGTGERGKWVSLPDFLKMLRELNASTSTPRIGVGCTSVVATHGTISRKSVTIVTPTLTARPWVTLSRMKNNPIYSPKRAFPFGGEALSFCFF